MFIIISLCLGLGLAWAICSFYTVYEAPEIGVSLSQIEHDVSDLERHGDKTAVARYYAVKETYTAFRRDEKAFMTDKLSIWMIVIFLLSCSAHSITGGHFLDKTLPFFAALFIFASIFRKRCIPNGSYYCATGWSAEEVKEVSDIKTLKSFEFHELEFRCRSESMRYYINSKTFYIVILCAFTVVSALYILL